MKIVITDAFGDYLQITDTIIEDDDLGDERVIQLDCNNSVVLGVKELDELIEALQKVREVIQ